MRRERLPGEVIYIYLVPVPVFILKNEQLCSNGGHDEKGEAAWRGHLSRGIIIFGTGTIFDIKKFTTVVFIM